MAVTTGTATSSTDLWDKLLAFITEDPDLVAEGAAWEQVWSNTVGAVRHVVMAGPASATGSRPMVGLRLFPAQYTAEEATISLSGCTGVSASATTFAEHRNGLARPVQAFVPNNSLMPYWFVCNARRFVAVWRIGTVYQAIYGGFILPYGTPTSYPYPLFVGGTRGFTSANTNLNPPPNSYSVATLQHSVFAIPCNATTYSQATTDIDTSACVLRPSLSWADVTGKGIPAPYVLPRARMAPFLYQKFVGPDGGHNDAGSSGVIPLNDNNREGEYAYSIPTLGYREVRSRTIAGLDGEFPLTRLTMSMPQTSLTGEYAQTLGALDGVFAVPGIGNSAENIVTLDGVDHIVFPNVYQTGSMDFWALALE